MAEVNDLEHEVSEYNKKGLVPCISKGEWWCVTNINEQMGVLMEKKNGHAAVFDQLMCESRNVMDFIKGLRDQRDELNQEIQAKTAVPALQSVTGTLEVVRLVPLREHNSDRKLSNGQFRGGVSSPWTFM